MDKSFAEWLLEKMRQKGMSQSDLAKRANVSRQSISDYINEKRRKPDSDSLKSIAHALNVSEDEILEAARIKSPSKGTDHFKEHILYLADQLPEEEYQDLVRYIEMRLEIARERGKIPPYATPTDKPAPG